MGTALLRGLEVRLSREQGAGGGNAVRETYLAWMSSISLYRAKVSGSADSPAVSQP